MKRKPRRDDIVAVKNLPKDELLASGHRACQGCAEALAVRVVLKALGKDSVTAMATGCMEIISSPLPTTAWKVPWIHVAFENSAAVASGIESGLKILMKKGKLPRKTIHVASMAGDGGTADIGLQAVSGALERGHDMVVVCYDNEAYMNTGIQRSSATPFGASTTTSPAGKMAFGQATQKKNMAEIAVAHNIPYVATACSSYPLDLYDKVKRAAETNGPAYVHVLSVCPTGWRIPSEQAITYGRLAVETRFFPLYEVINGEYHLSLLPDPPRPIEEYFKGQGRFRHLTPDLVKTIQERINKEWDKLIKKCVNLDKFKPAPPKPTEEAKPGEAPKPAEAPQPAEPAAPPPAPAPAPVKVQPKPAPAPAKPVAKKKPKPAGRPKKAVARKKKAAARKKAAVKKPKAPAKKAGAAKKKKSAARKKTGKR